MLNRSSSLVVSTSVLKDLPGKLDIKRLSLSILYFLSYKNTTVVCRLQGMTDTKGYAFIYIIFGTIIILVSGP